MTKRSAAFALLPGLLLVAACSAAPGSDPSATTSEAISGGIPSAYPIVQVSQANWITGASGTLISDSWVLSGFNAAELTTEPVTVCLTPGGPCVTSSEIYPHVGGRFGNLVHLPQPLEHLASYPALSTTALAVNDVLTCAGTSPSGPMQGAFELTGQPGAGDLFYPTAVGAAQLQGLDMGGGCFVNDTLAGVVGKVGAVIEDVAPIAAAITSEMCGGRTCGTVLDGQNVIACGACADGEFCSKYGYCTTPKVPPPHCDGLCM
jgi:hypothetical protein